MGFDDRTLQCIDCGAKFIFSSEEQEVFQSKGYTNEPKRCPACREARKERQGNTGYRNGGYTQRPQRQMYPAACAQCGKHTEVPFEPREGRPVYCRECYNKTRPIR